MTIRAKPGLERILIVDDHRISSLHLLASLKDSDSSIRHVRTARHAVSTALSWRPALICMDWQLPGADGLEAIRRILDSWPERAVPPTILLLTGTDPGLSGREQSALNISRILLKPVSGHQLRKAIGLTRSGEVKEHDSVQGSGDLQHLFRLELRDSLQRLDRLLADFRLEQAAAILHRLIASSAIVGEQRLENRLRRLDKTVKSERKISDLAADYQSLLTAAHDFLYRKVRSCGDGH